jgi:hypothetical protein
MKVNNINIYGLKESLIASGYPMSAKTINIEQYIKNSNVDFEHDFKRGAKLASTPIGSGHDNFLNGIVVQFDLQAPIKMWTELQRYHFINFVSSQSTMHCITKFNLDIQYEPYVDQKIIDRMKELVEQYNKEPSEELYLIILHSNPCGFLLTARMSTNYRQLKTIYQQRKNHRLPCWRDFCNWIETLPYAKELIINNKDNK